MEKKCTVATGPVFLFFPTFQRFSCFPVFYCLSCLFVCLLLFFSSKNLNFQVFSYTGFLQILENLENLEKSTNFIKVREKSGIFFILKAVCIYFLSFLRMIFFFLLIFCMYTLLKKVVLGHYFTYTSFFG